MKVTTFIKKKNKIIYDITGIILVPKEQIEECKKHRLSIHTVVDACPYCHVYNTNYSNCSNCPMKIAGNRCSNLSSTWEQLVNFVTYNTESKGVLEWYQSIPKLVKLYKKYNKQFDK